MINLLKDNAVRENGFPILANGSIADYFTVDYQGRLCESHGKTAEILQRCENIVDYFPMLRQYLDNPETPGRFYEIANNSQIYNEDNPNQAVYFGSIPSDDRIIGIIYNDISQDTAFKTIESELFILSLITQAVRAFNRAYNLRDILKIVLIGVTAGSGLGFNRAFILLTCDEPKCLKGALAHGPSSPEEAGIIWQKLSSGELSLEHMFDEALKKEDAGSPFLNKFIKDLVIYLDNKDNVFAKHAIEKKSIIIDEITLANGEYPELHSKIGPGPLAVVPLVGNECLQGVLIADNFITRKKITNNDIHLLEIFARYASDSIEKFRLYKNLEKKIKALKQANETILMNRENIVKAERLNVLSEMAGQVAHEIRNPLTVIGGFSKFMLKKKSKDHDDFENLTMIIDQVSRIEQALENFTSLMNYQSKDDRVCNLGELVKSALSISSSEPNESGFDVHSDYQVMIKVDPDLLRQALLIILKKALMIRPPQYQISLTITRSGNKALIYFKSIESNGYFAADLYKSFNALGNHQKMREFLTSLEILKYYGGNIGLEAAHNEGKRFYLELPAYEEA
ncbi:MAG: hypothetical protein J7K40_08590 [candidate division Zixibacteria bacterium]|nr:hypothetical protein [candidate division Zixibacteria bacterium]